MDHVVLSHQPDWDQKMTLEAGIKEDAAQKDSRVLSGGWWTRPVVRMAAVLVLGIGLGLILRSELLPSQSGILADSSLKRVEAHEKAYESAISDLENEAGAQLTEMDLELMLLYYDRLETIDEQIKDTRASIDAESKYGKISVNFGDNQGTAKGHLTFGEGGIPILLKTDKDITVSENE